MKVLMLVLFLSVSCFGNIELPWFKPYAEPVVEDVEPVIFKATIDGGSFTCMGVEIRIDLPKTTRRIEYMGLEFNCYLMGE